MAYRSLQLVFYGSVSEIFLFLIAHRLLCFSTLIIFGSLIWHVYSKRHRRNYVKTYPTVSGITLLRAILAGRKRATTAFLEIVFSFCSLYLKEGMFEMRILHKKYLFMYNVEAAETVLKSPTMLTKGIEYKFFGPLLGNGLVTSKGQKWRTRRKQLNPAFHYRLIAEFLHVFNKQAKVLVENIDELMKTESSVDIVHVIGLYTLDEILETAMSTSTEMIEADRRTTYLEAGHAAAKILGKRTFLPWLWSDFIFRRTEEGKAQRKFSFVTEKFIREIIQERIQKERERYNDNTQPSSTSGEGKQHLCLLDLLINLHLKENSVSLQEIFDEVVTFISAAHGTTSIAVSWTLYLLGWHQNIQREVQNEIDAVLGDDADKIITTEDINALKYLCCAFKEAMRIYPPISFFGRTLEEDATIGGHEIKKGTTLFLVAYALHRNPENFPNPEEFIPERFNEKSSKTRHPFAYIPFSAGPRNCIGQKYATYSSLTFLANVLRHFNVTSVEHRDRIQLSMELSTMPENGLLLRFTKRPVLRNYSF